MIWHPYFLNKIEFNCMVKQLILVLVLVSVFVEVNAQNPISPPGVYLADPSARLFNDGKLYLYTSQDESCDFYCSYRHSILSTSDMKTWEVHSDNITSKGENDAIEGSDALLFAPDAAEVKGKYHL